MQDWEKTNYEAYSELNHSQDDELMHFGVKGMSWKKGAEYLKEGGRLVNGVVVYANGQVKKAAKAIDTATGGKAGRAKTVQNSKVALKKAFKATGKAIDKGAYKAGNAMAKAVNSKQTAKVAAKLKAKLSKNKVGKKVVEVADKVAKNLNSKGAKQFRKDLAYKVNNTYKNKVDSKVAAKRKAEEDAKKAAARKAEARRKAEQQKAAKEAAARKAAEDARKREEEQRQALRDRDAKIKSDAEAKRKAEEDAKKAAAKKDADALEAGKQGLKDRQKEADFQKNVLNNKAIQNDVYAMAENILGKSYGTKFRASTYEKIIRDCYDDKTGKVDMRKARDYIYTIKKSN